MKLTIITVTKNCRDFLSRTHQTIQAQESQLFDWVIVDALSSDGTRELIEEIASTSNIRVIDRAPYGIYDAMNIGANDVKSGWILFLNAGDILLSTKSLSRVQNAFLEFSNADCIALPVAHLTPNGFLYDVTFPGIEINHIRIHHQGAFIAAEAFHRSGGYDTKLMWAADGKLLDEICLKGKVASSTLIEIGFEIGGASAIHYREVLSEISTYRKPANSGFRVRLLQIKNEIKLMIVSLSKSKIAPLITKYFVRRQRKVLTLIPEDKAASFRDEDWHFRNSLNLKF